MNKYQIAGIFLLIGWSITYIVYGVITFGENVCALDLSNPLHLNFNVFIYVLGLLQFCELTSRIIYLTCELYFQEYCVSDRIRHLFLPVYLLLNFLATLWAYDKPRLCFAKDSNFFIVCKIFVIFNYFFILIRHLLVWFLFDVNNFRDARMERLNELVHVDYLEV